MADSETLSAQDKDFLEKCEEEFKDRFTDKDEEFMKVFNSEPSKPPIIESWWVPQNSNRRNDHRHNRSHHPYDRHGNRERGYHNRREYNGGRGLSDDRGYGYYQRQRY